MDQAHQGDLEVDPWVRCVAHGDLRPPEVLHGPHQGGEPDPAGLRCQCIAFGTGHRDEFGGDQSQEPLAEVVDQVDGELLGTEPGGSQVGHGYQCPGYISFGQRFNDLVELGQIVIDGVRGGHLVEDGKGIAGRTPTPSDGQIQGLVAHVEPGIGAHLGQKSRERIRAQEPELVVLGAAADGGQDLLGVGGGQHEDDVGRGLFKGLEEGVGGCRRQHVDLVDDVDLLAAGRSEGRPGYQVAHGVDPVVGCGVQLMDVHRGAAGDLHTRRAHTAGLTVVQIGAVERLGQDAGGGGLAGASGAAEQVGVGHPAVAHGVAQGEHNMVLPADLFERRRSEPSVQGLVGGFLGRVGHVGEPTGRVGQCPRGSRDPPRGARNQRGQRAATSPVVGATARLTAAHALAR